MGKKIMSRRERVYKTIDGERDYQDNLGLDRVDGHTHTVGEELILMNVHLDLAKAAWVNNPGDIEALEQVRKIAAIAVRCMENHGNPERKPMSRL